MENTSIDIRLQSPFTALISGPTGSGKTTLLLNLIKNSQKVSTPPPKEIIYCYSIWQTVFNSFENVKFHQGMIDIDDVTFNDKENRWIIIDDLMDEVGGTKDMDSLFTKQSHHLNLSVFFIVQNLFHKKTRQISLNCHYMFLFNNPRDRSTIRTLGIQLYPNNPKFLVDIYTQITLGHPFSHMFIDLKQSTLEQCRIRNGFAGNSKGEIILYCKSKMKQKK